VIGSLSKMNVEWILPSNSRFHDNLQVKITYEINVGGNVLRKEICDGKMWNSHK
jgi:hypothetical protein